MPYPGHFPLGQRQSVVSILAVTPANRRYSLNVEFIIYALSRNRWESFKVAFLELTRVKLELSY